MSRRRLFSSVLVSLLGLMIPIGLAGGILAEDKGPRPQQKAEKPATAASPSADARRLFEAFLKDPTKENFLRVRGAVVSDPRYAPYASDLKDVEGLVKKKQFKEAKAALDKAGTNLLLTPAAHLCAARIAVELGDGARVDRELDARRKCLQGILSTGDGSPGKPHLVTRVSEEYEVLRFLKKRSSSQGLKIADGKYFDVLQCADGPVWFDVTAAFGALGRKFKAQQK